MVNGPGVFEKKEGRKEGKKREGRQERKKVEEKYIPCWGQEFVKNATQIPHNHRNCLLDFSVKVSHYGTRFVRFLSYKFFLHKFYGYVIMYIEVCEYPIFLEDYNLSKCSIFVPFSAFYLVLENNVASPAFQ